MSVMLYRKGVSHRLHGFDVDTCVVPEDEVDGLLKEGWARSPTLAYEAPKPTRKRRTKAEMEAARANDNQA